MRIDKTADIDKSKLLFSNKDLVKLIIPLILQQVLGVLVSTVDTVMVSSAGEAAVSGVSLVGTLDTLLVIFFTSLISGGAVLIAQTMGKKDYPGACEASKQLLYCSTAAALLITVTVQLLRVPLLHLLFGDAEADVMANAQDYFFFVSMSFPLLAISESIAATFRSQGNTLISMLVSLCTNLVNIGGNALLIMVFGLGAKGAAIATVFARLTGVVILMILIHNKKHPVHLERLFHYRPDFGAIKRILRIGVPNGIENAMFQFGRLLTQSLISSMGTAVIAANAVALTVSNFQYMTGTACSSAMVTVVGRCIGAGEKQQAKRYSRILLALNYVALWAVILVTAIFLSPIVSSFDLSDASASLAKQLILYHAAFAAAIWPIGFMLPSAFRASGDVRFSMIISMLSMWLFRVAGGYVLALPTVSVFGLFSFPGLGMGIMGVWVAMTVDWVFRVSFFLWRYLSGRWLKAKKLV